MTVRSANTNDVPRMVQLAAQKRHEYAEHLPFWRPAADAEVAQTAFFEHLIEDDAAICLVHEGTREVDGFLIANVTAAPPVYDPGGKGCLIDDFVVASRRQWATVGLALFREAESRAAELGAIFSIVVCGHHDGEKRQALASMGAYIGTEFHVHPIDGAGQLAAGADR